MKIDIWDILVIAGWLIMGAGIWAIDWRYALIVNGILMMLGGGKALRRG